VKRCIRWGTAPALFCVLMLGLVPGVAAVGPTRATYSQSNSIDIAAGFACDFPLQYSYRYTYREVIFVNPSRTVLYLRLSAVYVNLETGYTLFERAEVTQTYHEDGRARYVGLVGQLRDIRGRLVGVSSGQFIATYPVSGPLYVKVTPHMTPDFYVRICTALGGHSAGYP
jgi:hypothetical protein